MLHNLLQMFYVPFATREGFEPFQKRIYSMPQLVELIHLTVVEPVETASPLVAIRAIKARRRRGGMLEEALNTFHI